MTRRKHSHVDQTLGDRLAAGLIGAVAGALTACALLFIPTASGGEAAVAVLTRAVPLGAGVGALLGFGCGSARLARYFGIVWSTEEGKLGEVLLLLSVVLAVVALAIYLHLSR